MFDFLGLPQLASAHGGDLDRLTGLIHIMMFVMFAAWLILFVYMLFRFSSKRNPKASYHGTKSKASSYAEVAVAIAEAFILVVFAIPLWAARVAEFPAEEESVMVRVVGEQFAWNIHYPGPDGVFGRTAPELVDVETNPLGLDSDDPFSKDDISTVNQLHLPVDKPVIVQLSAKDVIHSFGLPEMRVKQDAMPGMMIPVHFTPTVTSAQMAERVGRPDFTYEIKCAQLCGLGHYRMKGYMTIHTQEEFEAWLVENAPSEDEADEFWG